MKKKIKITESQLKHIVQNKNIKEDLDIKELGGMFHIDNDGNFKEGEGPMPSPEEMADIVAKQIKIHPDYFKPENSGAFYEFFDRLQEILTVDNESRSMFPNTEIEKLSNVETNKLNESKEKFKSDFKRYL
jgi:hypothetical protein